MDKPTIFISYSHKDESWKNRLLPQLRALEMAGRITVWDDRQIDGGDKWYPEIKQAMEHAAVAVCLISSDYLASHFCVKEEIPYLLERCEKDGLVFLPLLLRPCPWKAFDWLKERQMLPRDGKTIAVDFKEDWDTVFAEVANQIFDLSDQLPVRSAVALGVSVPAWSPPEKLDISRLPVTGSDLFGRQKELTLLDEAWELAATNVVSFVAWGGVGKSTLVNKWLERLAKDNYRGARSVFAWSFYSQGTTERATSADLFIHTALEWFGDEDPTTGSPWDKGERLARLVRRQRTLLVLDGMEPLQSAQAFERGKIKDPALATLVEELARDNPGLCLITTRERISNLDEGLFASPLAVPPSGGGLVDERDQLQMRVPQIDLERLSPEAGRALLRIGGVRGTDEELERAAESFGRHALALNLLTAYLQDVPGHSVSAAAQIPDLDIPEAEGRHPRRMIAAFEQKFGEGPEIEVLRLLGLFDRPADGASLAALRKAPKIPGLTDARAKAAWFRAVQTLRKCKLLAAESRHDPDELDAHPLVREHFRQQLQRHHPDAWREANLRLYEHLCATTKELPNTVEEMAPLFAAVAHGCEAGKQQETFMRVYWWRIHRGNEFYLLKKLGAVAADLAVLQNFFTVLWSEPSAKLTLHIQATVLDQAGSDLRALGRVPEAPQPMKASLAMYISEGDLVAAAGTASNLSEVYLTLGDLPNAHIAAQQSVELSIQSGDMSWQMLSRVTLAYVEHQSGRPIEAEIAFRAAGTLQKEFQPTYPQLYALQGFRYCNFLLEQGRLEEVRIRATQTLRWAEQQLGPFPVALDKLSLGRVWLLQSRHAGAGDYEQAAELLQRAVDGLRLAGQMDYLPRGLLARAELRRVSGDYQRARTDLDEAQRLAER
ncbi:MAG: TIR domain-containing protein, partial [Acidobacteriota bacterium]